MWPSLTPQMRLGRLLVTPSPELVTNSVNPKQRPKATLDARRVSTREEWASGAVEFHHRALSEPDVSLSAHPAPDIRLLAYRSGQCAKSSGLILMIRASHSRALFGFCLKRLNLRRAHFLRWKSSRRRLLCIADL
jgi:hypothetical protein